MGLQKTIGAMIIRLGVPGLAPVLAHDRNLAQAGFLTTSQLARKAALGGFTLTNIFDVRISPNSTIMSGVEIGGGVTIDGKVRIGEGSILERCRISGNGIVIGSGNRFYDTSIGQNGVTIMNNNVFTGTKIFPQDGKNGNANLCIGSDNNFGRTNIHNETGEAIYIGDHNQFGDGAQIRSMVAGWIHIGSYNSIGMDGGGVLSTAYNFGNKWCGPVYVGYGLATKRGAEVLGLGAYGVTSDMAIAALAQYGISSETPYAGQLLSIFSQGMPADIERFLGYLRDLSVPADQMPKKTVLIVGATKPKASIILGMPEAVTEVRDGTRIHHSVVMPGTNVGERCKIYFSTAEGAVDADTKLIGNDIPSTIDPGYPDSWTNELFRR
jgi:acyl-[acyl carrier protein]--UDP-N-acetylglucosamine O-acyltransferase